MHKVIIIGAGFAGLQAVKGLTIPSLEVTIIDKHNYHLFQPLLYQVATAGLSPSDIAVPIRNIFRSQQNKNFRFCLTRFSIVLSKNIFLKENIFLKV